MAPLATVEPLLTVTRLTVPQNADVHELLHPNPVGKRRYKRRPRLESRGLWWPADRWLWNWWVARKQSSGKQQPLPRPAQAYICLETRKPGSGRKPRKPRRKI